MSNIAKETLEQFTERMSHTEKKQEFQVGMRHQGNSRAIFEFEGQTCFLESFGYPTEYDKKLNPAVLCLRAIYNNPKQRWLHVTNFTKQRAKKAMKYYGAKYLEEDPYPKEEGVWYSLVFNEFDDLMKMVYDIHIGKFEELFGKETKVYESCI